MSSRHLRKLQERQAEASQQADASEDSEHEGHPPTQPARNAFAGLLDSDEEDDEDASAEQPTSVEQPLVSPASVDAAGSDGPRKPSNKQRRAAKQRPEEELDEHELLAAAAAERAAFSEIPAEAEAEAEADLLKLSTSHLDATNELARTFGRGTLRKIVAAERAERGAGRGPGAAAGHQGGRRAAKTVFVRPRDTWPPVRSGLGMELQRSEGGLSWFVFTHSSLYAQSEQELQLCVQSADPNSLHRLLRTYPYQLDALLLLADYCGRTAQHELASELVERALFGCETALHPLCKPWLGTARLSWEEPANRPFLKALSRHMHSVARRGCPRTALELGRLLLSLSPERDPLHACLHLDHFALRAAAAVPADAMWVLRLTRCYPAHGLPLYPNYALSAAAALRVLGRAEAAATQLRRALLLFPAVLPLLAREAMAEFPRAARVAAAWEEEMGAAARLSAVGATLRTLLELYAARHAALWREQAEREWLLGEANALLDALRRADAEALRLRDDCAAVRVAEYGGGAAEHDEFVEADPADFTPALPAQLPADEGDPWLGAGPDGAALRRPPRLPGRLVVPREERLQLDPHTHPLKQFFLSLLPWAMPPG